MSNKIEEVDGVKWVIGLSSLIGPNMPESMIPDSPAGYPSDEGLRADVYLLGLQVGDG